MNDSLLSPPPSRMRVLADMGSFADDVLGRIARARQRVDVESYIVRGDRLGGALAQALTAAAARGVRCRLLHDALGSRRTARAYFDTLAAGGVAVRRFGWIGATIANWLRGGPAAQNHARVIVVDDVAYTGGHAWGDEWLPTARGGQGWHDVCCAAEGAIVEDFAALFEQHWRESDVRKRIADYVGELRDGLRLVSDAPIKESVVLGRHLDAIGAARRRVWIANSYFFPPAILLDALVAARARGVDVKIIVPGVSDIRFIQWAAEAAYQRWIAAGLELWEYQGVVMHSKYAVVDDDWCLVGTFNANVVSVAFAIEVALVSSRPSDASASADQMSRDFAQSRIVDEVRLRGVGLVRSIVGHIARTVMTLLSLIFHRRPIPLPPAGPEVNEP